jgi:hypothetical protein
MAEDDRVSAKVLQPLSRSSDTNWVIARDGEGVDAGSVWKLPEFHFPFLEQSCQGFQLPSRC